MGKSFPIYTLNSEVSDWLVTIDVLESPIICKSRYPTFQELMRSINSVENIGIEFAYYEPQKNYMQFNIFEEVDTEPSRWAQIILSDFSPQIIDEQKSVEFYFYRVGQEAIVNEIMEAVVEFCGPLVLLRDHDNPEIFYPKGFEIE